MPLLNILINNKTIKQTVKPAVHAQNMSGLIMLQCKVNCFVTYKTQLMNPLNLLMKVSIGQSKQYKTC